ncbi:tetratricopeptide repeat protein [Treponema sp.]|uniref:tetratricopeptide repeat protein n=1 Tax=Treponema sp. TaxID=166 RepID=UPI00298E6E09|nr:tetratricopeptide repeat protein [Treponema sp.]MCR5612366.1 tetratricopeptide repeat protein [Treponema sp.]
MKLKQNILLITAISALTINSLSLTSCSNKTAKKATYIENIAQMSELLKSDNLTDEARYALINKIARTLLANNQHEQLVLYLTDWVESHPNDKFNAYWLLMVAYSYKQTNSEPMAEFYFERIIKNYPDLEVSAFDDTKKQSVHFLCLENLIKISRNPDSRIKYFNQLINRFPSNVSITEMYIRLAREYSAIGEWKKSLKTYSMFLEQPDAATIQIADIPDAYSYAKNLIDFDKSPKNWTFKSLPELENAIKEAIFRYQPNKLDTYRSKVNFFAVSWKQDENASTGQVDFSMANYMHGNRIVCDKELIPGPTTHEAYLRTKGWTTMPTWYFYFREVNFPADPDIHGTWEWAGIYIGDML